jgi:hypothetical protein
MAAKNTSMGQVVNQVEVRVKKTEAQCVSKTSSLVLKHLFSFPSILTYKLFLDAQSFTDALDEFLSKFGRQNIPQWATTMKYSGVGELTFKKSLRINEESKHYLGKSSFEGIDKFNKWFGKLLSSGDLKDDPVHGIYVIVIAEGENFR